MRPKMIQPIPFPDEWTPAQRFEWLMKGLISVPKQEIDKAIAKEKQERASKRKATKRK